MELPRALALLTLGVTKLGQAEKDWIEEDNFYRGTHERPFAPEGVNKEYRELQDMAVAPWIRLVCRTPVQRLRADGFRTGRDGESDMTTWREVWQANGLDSRQRIVYTDAIVHGRGIMSVWPNKANRAQPIVRPESPRLVHIEPNPDDPFSSIWAVKQWAGVEDDGTGSRTREVTHAVLYTDREFWRFKKTSTAWEFVSKGANPLGRVPFVEFSPEFDAAGTGQSMIRPLFPMQRAIDTARFDLLLAMQFSAYRQRVVVGFDPVMRDGEGNPIWRKDPDGNDLVDPVTGLKIPILNTPGRPGVDRVLMFPGGDTKVFDLPESNLAAYIEIITMFVQHLAAIAQVPPQYLLGGMANLSGEALTAAESTLASLVDDLQRAFGESLEEVMRLANIARGDGQPDIASEVVWGDGQARSFAQTVDGIQKLVSIGFPLEGGLEMLPGATIQKVHRWMKMANAEAADPFVDGLRDNAAAPTEIDELKSRADAVGALRRAGVTAASSASTAGLPGLEFVEGDPITIRAPEHVSTATGE